jgi:Domain of unknown function (DUF6895)
VTARKVSWAETDLLRRLCYSLDVAKSAINNLASDGFTDAKDPANNVRPEKVIAETGLLLLAASTAIRYGDVKKRFREVAELLVPRARSVRMFLGICTMPSLAWDYALGHICLKRLGYPDARFDSVLEMIRKSQSQPGSERPPNRVLEQIWASRVFQPAEAEAVRRTAPSVVRESMLCRPMDFLAGSREDIYAFTHSLMYISDLNIPPWRLPRPRSTILADAESALARCLDDQDYDVAGELLLTWPLTGTSWGASAAFGFRVLAHVEDRAGFLPSAGTQLDRVMTLQGEDRAKYLLATAYHTAYVMGLLCAVTLQPRRAPPKAIKGTKGASGISQVILAKLDEDRQRPHWREEFDELSQSQRDSLATMLVTIGLRRSVVQRDFSRLHEFLQLGHKANLTNTPTASQAAELLARLAQVS